jgi:hypothetical protein
VAEETAPVPAPSEAAIEADKNVAALLEWLGTFKSFYNKLTLKSANSV